MQVPGNYIVTTLRIVAVNMVLGVIAVASLEVIARVWLVNFSSDDAFIQLATPAQYKRYRPECALLTPHPYMGYVPRKNAHREKMNINSLGFRGEEFSTTKNPDVYRIICMGGSTTFDDQVYDDEQSYPRQLESMLHSKGYNVEVINAGVPGWSSVENLINYQLRLRYFAPDLIIIPADFNDMVTRLVPPEKYASDNTGAKEVFMYDVPWYEHFILGRFWSIQINGNPCLLERLNYRNSKSLFTLPNHPYFREHSLSELLAQNKPIYYLANMANLIKLAEDDGAKCMLLTTPFNRAPEGLQVGFATEDQISDTLQDEIWDACNEMNRITQELASEHSVLICDLTKAFPAIDKEKQYFNDTVHMNATGSLRKAETIADYLVQAGVIPMSSNSAESTASPDS